MEPIIIGKDYRTVYRTGFSVEPNVETFRKQVSIHLIQDSERYQEQVLWHGQERAAKHVQGDCQHSWKIR